MLAQELTEEELLISCDSEADEIKKSNQPEESSQSETEKVDNRLPYEKPLLRKYGKINDGTNITFFDGVSFDGQPGYIDIS